MDIAAVAHHSRLRVVAVVGTEIMAVRRIEMRPVIGGHAGLAPEIGVAARHVTQRPQRQRIQSQEHRRC